MSRFTLGCLLLVGLTPRWADAAGFALSEQGAASFGLAGAATARIDLADRGFYNPAGWALHDGLELAADLSVIAPTLSHEDPNSGVRTVSDDHVATPFAAHVGVSHGWEGYGHFALALSAGVPFGASLSWPADWAGRYEVRSIGLQVLESSMALAYGHRWERLDWGVSAGLRLLTGRVGLAKAIDVVTDDAGVELQGRATAVAWHAGAVVRWADDFVLGMNWRAGSELNFEGDAHFSGIPVELNEAARDQSVSTSVRLPHRIALGAAYDLGVGVLSVDWTYFAWSSFERFAVDFEEEATPDVDERRNWEDRSSIRAGYEHRALGELPLFLRLGVGYDPSPSPRSTLSPTLPDADRILITSGLRWTIAESFAVDVAYGYISLLETSAEGAESFPAVYSGRAHGGSIGLSYSWCPASGVAAAERGGAGQATAECEQD